MPNIVLYHMPASNTCRAVRMAARALSIVMDLKEVDLAAEEQLKPEFIQMNPQHTVPTIDDNGFILWESHTILRYLVNRYVPDSELYPKDPQERAIVDRLLDFDLGTLYIAEANYMYPEMLHGQSRDPKMEEPLKRALGFLNTFLQKTKYVAGDHLTLADFSIIASLSLLEVIDYDYTCGYPEIAAWSERIKTGLPYYKEINEQALAEFKVWVKERKQK